ncbi:DUF1289 domain-containing protein [Vibrio sp. TRT 21S02]
MKGNKIDQSRTPIVFNKANLNDDLSPCIRQCCLDEDDVCVGCYRTLGEILAWHQLSSNERHEVLQQCEHRSALKKQIKPF